MKSIAMKNSATTLTHGLAGAALLLALAGCERQDPAPEPIASEPAPHPTSIIREDMDDTLAPPPEPQLAPLDARISFSAVSYTHLTLPTKRIV